MNHQAGDDRRRPSETRPEQDPGGRHQRAAATEDAERQRRDRVVREDGQRSLLQPLLRQRGDDEELTLHRRGEHEEIENDQRGSGLEL